MPFLATQANKHTHIHTETHTYIHTHTITHKQRTHTNTNKQTLVHHSDIKKSRMGLKLRERKYSGVNKIYFFEGGG